MEVNVKLVRASYESLKAEYESLEDIELNLFSSIGNINNFDWIDGNSMENKSKFDMLLTECFQCQLS